MSSDESYQSLMFLFRLSIRKYRNICARGGFFQANSNFLTSHFRRYFLYHLKGIVVLSLNLARYFTCDYFLYSYGGLKIAILANLGQITRDIFRAINA